MAGLTHRFTSPKADDVDATLIRPSNWNDIHRGVEWFRVTADIVKSDLTLADITGFGAIPVAASEIIAFEACIFSLAAAITTGMSFAVSGPASPANLIAVAEMYTTATATVVATTAALATKMTSTAQLTTVTPQYVYGVLENGVNAGNFALQWSPEVAASATIKRGSFMRIYRF